MYALTHGHGKFGSLQDLITQNMAAGYQNGNMKSGYIFASTPINVEGLRAMFDTTAKPSSTGTFGSGNRSYYSNETLSNTVYQADGGEPPTATPQDRLPKNGEPRNE